jgi:Uma2 family endonuclease
MMRPDQNLIDELMQVEGKAEIVDGEVRLMEAAGEWPHGAAFEIAVSLRQYARTTGRGRAAGDGLGFLVDLPNRRSFSPDAAFYKASSTGMDFQEGAPLFAVEVRSKGDYGPAAERRMAAKRADYFAAGTLVVWDVDLIGRDTVSVYRDGNAHVPAAIYRRDDLAEAEPALPGWRLPVNDLFA